MFRIFLKVKHHTAKLRALKFWFGILLLGGFSTAFAQSTTDVVVNISSAPDLAPAFSVFTVTFTVNNSTTVNAENVQLLASLPSLPVGGSVDLISYPTGTCAGTGISLTCNLGTMAGGAVQTITVQYRLGGAIGGWPIHGDVSTTTPEVNTGNNHVIYTVNTSDASELSLAVNGTIGDLVAGQPFTYPLVITDNGPSDTDTGTTTLTFTVPDNIRFTGAGGWSCSPVPANAGTLVTCTNNGAFHSGTTKTINVNAVAMASASSAIDTSFSVQQVAGWPDPEPDNNTVAVPVQISPGTDASISKNVQITDDQLVYTITPSLQAGDLLTGVPITVIDRYGADQLNFVSWATNPATDGWSCAGPVADGTDMVITCTRTGFSGANYTDMPALKFLATPGNDVSATNVASISLTGRNDPNSPNDSATATIGTTDSADLTTIKTPSFTPVVAGQQFTYSMASRNLGPWNIPAGQTITLTDQLPANLTLLQPPAADATYWTSCQATQGGAPIATYPATSTAAAPITVQCTSASGLGGGSNTPSVVITVQISQPGDLTNTACSSLAAKGANASWRTDPNSANNCSDGSDSAVLVTTESADLEVLKTAGSATVNAAQPLTYTIAVTNHGPDTATHIVVTDGLTSLLNSGGLQSLTISGATGVCAVDGNSAVTYPVDGTSHNVQCTLDSLANGQTANVLVTALPVIADTGDRSNTATAYSTDVGDPDRDNNASTVTSTVKAVYDLTVTTDATSAGVTPASSAPANSIILFTTHVTSVGPSSAPEGQVIITLPANATFLQLDSAGGGACTPDPATLVSTTGQTLTCVWTSPLTAGSTRDITYEVMAPNTVGATVTNKAAVSLPSSVTQPESRLDNNTAQADVTITAASVDLQVSISNAPDPVSLGDSTTFTIVVRNNGPSLATDVALNDVIQKLNATYSYQGGLTVDQDGACTEPALGAFEGSVTCNWASLGIGASATVTYTMKAESIVPGLQSGTTLATATVSATETEIAVANNTAVKETTARRNSLGSPGADLGIVKTASKSSVSLGESFTYTLTVTNHGPEDVTTEQGAEIIDVLPKGVELTATPAGCSYDDSSRTLICLVGNLANGAQFAVTVPVKASAGGGLSLVNTASVDMPDDLDSSNNQSTVPVTLVTSIPALSHGGLIALALLLLAALRARQQRRA